MKRILQVLFLMLLFPLLSLAQPAGSSRANPIMVGTFGGSGGTFSDTRSNNPSLGYGSTAGTTDAHDIYYRFVLTSPQYYNLTVCNPSTRSSYILMDSQGNSMVKNFSPGIGCQVTQKGTVKGILNAGTYYFMVETTTSPIPGQLTYANIQTAMDFTAFFPSSSSTFSGSKNYVVAYTPRVAGIFSSADLQGRTVDEVRPSVRYYDGLGRPVQTVDVMALHSNRTSYPILHTTSMAGSPENTFPT